MKMGPFLLTAIYFVIAIAIVLIGLILFELLTKKYKDWDEVLNGNHAVSLSIGGKIVGICIILAFSIYHSASVVDTLIWGAYGVLLQMIAYLLFELFTRKFSVEEQLKKGNISVGIISMCVSIGLGFVIGASIT
jgi:putative membrane protein